VQGMPTSPTSIMCLRRRYVNARNGSRSRLARSRCFLSSPLFPLLHSDMFPSRLVRRRVNAKEVRFVMEGMDG
jgi:hypothetical protein